jgi:hypothetical protein
MLAEPRTRNVEGACPEVCPFAEFTLGEARAQGDEAYGRAGRLTVQVVSNPPRVLYTVVTVSRCGRSTPKRSSAILAVACS